MATIHVTLNDSQQLSPEEEQNIFGGAITKHPMENGNTILFGPDQTSISDEQVAALSALSLPEQITGRGIMHRSSE